MCDFFLDLISRVCLDLINLLINLHPVGFYIIIVLRIFLVLRINRYLTIKLENIPNYGCTFHSLDNLQNSQEIFIIETTYKIWQCSINTIHVSYWLTTQ